MVDISVDISVVVFACADVVAAETIRGVSVGGSGRL